jgi:DNA-binding XRE family transcriptional regulator
MSKKKTFLGREKASSVRQEFHISRIRTEATINSSRRVREKIKRNILTSRRKKVLFNQKMVEKKKAGLTQEELANKIGTKRSAIPKWKNTPRT